MQVIKAMLTYCYSGRVGIDKKRMRKLITPAIWHYAKLPEMKTSREENESSLILLKKEVEETFGKKINSAGDCILLSADIYARISFNINSNTLRRFFGLVKSGKSPSSATLDILLKYCGFSSFDELTGLKDNTNKKKKDDYFARSLLHYLIAIFKNTPVKEYADKTFACVVKHTILLLQRHPELTDKFQRAISKTKNGQNFYYEQFVGLDQLNSFYGKGLRYYLMEKKTPEAQIFGHALLCLRDYISENPFGVNEHYREVIKYELTKDMHPIIWGRFYATKLFYLEVNALSIEQVLMEAQHAHTAIRESPGMFSHFPYFEYHISPVLLLTGHPQEALYYVNYAHNNYPGKQSQHEKALYQTLAIIKALVLARIGKIKEAKKLYEEIHPSKFYFQAKMINNIVYLVLGEHLKENDAISGQLLTELVAKTGFTKLYSL